jgi:hypothetical protein
MGGEAVGAAAVAPGRLRRTVSMAERRRRRGHGAGDARPGECSSPSLQEWGQAIRGQSGEWRSEGMRESERERKAWARKGGIVPSTSPRGGGPTTAYAPPPPPRCYFGLQCGSSHDKHLRP